MTWLTGSPSRPQRCWARCSSRGSARSSRCGSPPPDENVWNATAKEMLPRAVGYARGALDYFFRGQLEIRAPDRLVSRNRESRCARADHHCRAHSRAASSRSSAGRGSCFRGRPCPFALADREATSRGGFPPLLPVPRQVAQAVVGGVLVHVGE